MVTEEWNFFFFKNGIIEADIKEGVWLLQITG